MLATLVSASTFWRMSVMLTSSPSTRQLASDVSLSRLVESTLGALLRSIQNGSFPNVDEVAVLVLIRYVEKQSCTKRQSLTKDLEPRIRCLVRLTLKHLETFTGVSETRA